MAFETTIPPHVVHETIDGEVIILNLKDGLYHTLNESAGAIWELLASGHPLDGVASAFATTKSIPLDEARRMVRSIVRDLASEALIVQTGVEPEWLGATPATVNGEEDRDWPSIDTYRDMRAALVLDPVHDVDESGWPNPKRTTPDPE